MSEHVIPGRTGGLITLGAADALWVDLTAHSTVPTASAAFTRSPADAPAGYVLLGGHVVATVKTGDGRWSVPEPEVRRAAAELNAVEMDRQDLVRIGPFRDGPKQEYNENTPLRWRRRITQELQEPDESERAARCDGGRPYHLAGIDWRRILVENTRDRTARTWWLPRAVVRLLDVAEHTETRWLKAARTCQASATVTEPPSHHRQARAADGPQTTSPDRPTAPLRPYNEELKGHRYSVLSRKPGTSRKVAGWTCAICHTAPAAVLDHCHEHGYVRAPVCHSCNTQERPDHLYSNDIRVANRYTRLFHTHTTAWLCHWHRCPGCRTRTTLPLPHLAAWTAHIACRSLRPTHRDPRGSRGRTPCGALRVSWTGSHHAPGSCLLTVAVDLCPSGEHRVLAQVPYREAAERFRTWLAETAPAVAAAAGPDRLDGLPARSRPVIADTSGEGLALF
ncbi:MULTISPECIES: endonuclease domain-containing protein [Streptomyces]|uniref:Recombinase n=1 Tax=Streptomyces prasinus TaxID=67345 RepID=A0ABX6ANY1_9ACTN|nr:endonuclease domain-containing protein [Streptomyces prasinus]QEV04428.1 recombinase [Streptomyces prasinus]